MATKEVREAHKGFTKEQITQLLKPINQSRVLKDGKGFSHVSQQDILAHLTRIFGFGNFDIDVQEVGLVFESERTDKGVPTNRFDVCYRALVRLTIRDPFGNEICHFENGSMETAQNQSRGDAHDLAYKSAISLSIKRAAIALGDQFGLSLYNKGQMAALVKNTLVGITSDTIPVDVQEGVPQQVSLGNDEKDASEAVETVTNKPLNVTHTPVVPAVPSAPTVTVAPPTPAVEATMAPKVELASEGLLMTSYAIVEGATTLEQLRNVWTQSHKFLDQPFEPEAGFSVTLRIAIDSAKKRLEGTDNV